MNQPLYIRHPHLKPDSVTNAPKEKNMSEQNDLEIPSYIGRKRCGCVIAAVVDNGERPRMVSNALREFIRDRLIIERVTVGWVRTHKFGCEHEKDEPEAEQLEFGTKP